MHALSIALHSLALCASNFFFILVGFAVYTAFASGNQLLIQLPIACGGSVLCYILSRARHARAFLAASPDSPSTLLGIRSRLLVVSLGLRSNPLLYAGLLDLVFEHRCRVVVSSVHERHRAARGARQTGGTTAT